MTEDLIRSVVQEILAQMGTPGAASAADARRATLGSLGVFSNAADAVAAADDAFHRFKTRHLADRAKAVEVIKSICVDQAEELGRMELDETKIGRLDHKIA
jgi:aldehyde dehydrogenase